MSSLAGTMQQPRSPRYKTYARRLSDDRISERAWIDVSRKIELERGRGDRSVFPCLMASTAKCGSGDLDSAADNAVYVHCAILVDSLLEWLKFADVLISIQLWITARQ